MSEYQYYEFLAVDRPLDERQLAEVRALSTRARVTATSFTNEYHWGNFRGDPRTMMERYYDAHLYLTNWGTHQVMLRLPRALLSPETAEQFCIDPHVAAWTSGEHLILNLISEDDSGDWVEGAEYSLSAIVGVRAELAAGDLRPLYLAWLAAYGIWERDEDAFDYDEETDLEPPVPAGLGTLTAPQRALADFLRLDTSLLDIAAQASPLLAETKSDPRKLAKWIRDLPAGDKDTLLHRVAQGQGAQVHMELRRRSTVISVLALAVPAVQLPNCWTQLPKHVTNNCKTLTLLPHSPAPPDRGREHRDQDDQAADVWPRRLRAPPPPHPAQLNSTHRKCGRA